MGPIVNWEHWFGFLRATWFLVSRCRLGGTRDDQGLLRSSSVQLDPFPEADAEKVERGIFWAHLRKGWVRRIFIWRSIA